MRPASPLPSSARISAVLAAVWLAAASAAPVAAQEGWNPFDPHTFPQVGRRPPARSSTPPSDERALDAALAPMDRAPRWGDQGIGQPYAPPGQMPARDGTYAPAGPAQRQPEGRPHDSMPAASTQSYQPVELAPIERSELAPVMAGDGSGLPHEFWRGLDVGALERHITPLTLPPVSAALAALWRKLLTAEVAAPSGGSAAPFLAVRLEALHRSGLVEDERKLVAQLPVDGRTPALVVAMKARAEIGAGDSQAGCASARSLSARLEGLPEALRGEVLLFAGYCAAATKNAAAAGLAADLAREEGKETALGLQVLDAIALGTKPKLTLPKDVTLTDYRLLEIAGLADPAAILPKAVPALAAALAIDRTIDPATRVVAAEMAARHNAIAPAALADAYRSAPAGGGGREDATLRRARSFKAVESDRNPNNRTRGIRALLDDARRQPGLYLPMTQILAPLIRDVQRVPEIGWFAETAVETLIATGEYAGARDWIAFTRTLDGYGRGQPTARGMGLSHWLALADIADDRLVGSRGESLRTLEDMAVRGQLAPEFLHRLATVLDALDYNVPIPLWEAASRTPQPTTGFLPETGILTELQDAARKKEFGRTVLLAMRTLGPTGAEGAHMIALGDAMRALRRAGLSADARRVGFEALFMGWPRHTAQ